MGDRTTFEALDDGQKFKTIGVLTGELSLYTYEKTAPQKGQDEVTYNAIAFRGERRERRFSFWGSDRVEIVV